MSVVSPKTTKARDAIESVLTKLTVNLISMAEAKHELWRLLNGLTDRYDEGYNHGWRACEEEILGAKQRKDEPPYKELG